MTDINLGVGAANSASGAYTLAGKAGVDVLIGGTGRESPSESRESPIGFQL